MELTRRNRILRRTPAIRALVAETQLTPDDLILPLFIVEGEGISDPIASMPGYARHSIDRTVQELEQLCTLGLKSVLLFVKSADELKDNTGREAWNPDGLMQRAIRAIKHALPQLVVMTDVALDPYSSYGHDGIVENGEIVNDPTVDALVKMSLSHAAAGADLVAPSDMMDGRIGAIRQGFEQAGYTNTGILAYSAKYASCFYGPFRDALDSAPGMGDKKTYQMDPANRTEALREVRLDVDEGADIVMVKPGLPYLDIVREVRNAVDVPVAVYQVSGEYAMLKAAAAHGWIDEEKAVQETLLAFKRGGADIIASYFTKELLRRW